MRRLTPLFSFAILMPLVAGSAACGPSSGPDDDVSQADAVTDAAETVEPVPTVVDENLRIIYGYTSSTGQKPSELVVGNPSILPVDGNPSWSADFPIVERVLDDIGLDCTLGCLPNRDLTLMAVVTGTDSTTQGLILQVVAFDELLNAAPMLDQPISGVRQARLEGTTLFMSRFQADCEATTGNPKTCFRFESVSFPPGQRPSDPVTLFVFPPPDLLADSMHSGRFRLGADGSTLIIQDLRRDSVTFWLYDGADGLRSVGSPVCQTVDAVDGGCAYDAGAPDLTDDTPVALTPDRSRLLFAHVADNRELRLAAIDTETGAMTWTTLLGTPSRFNVNACYNLKPGWGYTRIQQPLIISRDGTELVFTAASECDPNLGKSWTNVVAVPVSLIGADQDPGDDFYRKITDFPAEPVPGCVSILPETMDLSESGAFLAFAGTPMLDSNGRAILDDSPQHYTDREVFVTAFDGIHSPIQVSGNAGYRASSVMFSSNDPAFAGATDPEIADP